MMGYGLYILDGDGQPLRCDDVVAWGYWYETNRHTTRRVARDTVVPGCEVSTVFLALDHRYGDDGPPILWETMVFGGPLDGEQDRYTSLADAKAGHAAMCARVLAAAVP